MQDCKAPVLQFKKKKKEKKMSYQAMKDMKEMQSNITMWKKPIWEWYIIGFQQQDNLEKEKLDRKTIERSVVSWN